MSPSVLFRWWRRQPSHDLVGFLLFSHGWTWLWWGVNVVAGYDAFGQGLPFTILGGLGPLLGGVVMTYVTYGRAGLADLRDRLTNPQRIRLPWAIVTIGFFPVLVLLTALFVGLVSGGQFPLETGIGELLREPGRLLTTVLVILIVGPLPEEIGWRGYLLDRCQARWSALASGLGVGVVWAVWHAPLFLMPGYFANFDFAPEPLWFASNIILVSVIYTWLYNNTVRSVLALIGFHFFENFVGQVTTLPPVADPIGLVIRGFVILGIIIWFGPRTFRREGELPTPPLAVQ